MSKERPFTDCYGCESWIDTLIGCASPDTCPLIVEKVQEVEFDKKHDELPDEYFDYGEDEMAADFEHDTRKEDRITNRPEE